MRFIAIARLVCASREIEPKLIAPVAKRLTISAAGSTSSSGIGFSASLNCISPRNGQQPLALLVDGVGERLVFRPIVAAHRMLQPRHRFRRPGMLFAAQAERIIAADIQHVAIDRIVAIGVVMARHAFLGDILQPDAFDSRRRAGEIFLDQSAEDSPTASKICAPQ